MKYLILLGFLGITVNASEELATRHGCINCHRIEQRAFGPSFKSISDKYKNDDKAPQNLLKKVRLGGTGSFGSIPMPPQTAPKKDLQEIIKWILSL